MERISLFMYRMWPLASVTSMLVGSLEAPARVRCSTNRRCDSVPPCVQTWVFSQSESCSIGLRCLVLGGAYATALEVLHLRVRSAVRRGEACAVCMQQTRVYLLHITALW